MDFSPQIYTLKAQIILLRYSLKHLLTNHALLQGDLFCWNMSNIWDLHTPSPHECVCMCMCMCMCLCHVHTMFACACVYVMCILCLHVNVSMSCTYYVCMWMCLHNHEHICICMWVCIPSAHKLQLQLKDRIIIYYTMSHLPPMWNNRIQISFIGYVFFLGGFVFGLFDHIALIQIL